jgi:Fibronectin type III domain
MRVLVAVVCVAACSVVAIPDAGWATPGVPSAPKAVKPVPGNQSALVTWAAPYSNGGHKVTAYQVIAYHKEFALAVNVFHSTRTTQIIVGLKQGDEYTFKVAAKNSVGWSQLSARSPAIEVGVPVAPAKPSAVGGDDRATVNWKTPKNNGAPLNWYRVLIFVSGSTQPPRLFKSTKVSQVVYGLKGGKRYQFKVEAHNKYGWSDPSPVSGTVLVK